MKAFAVFTMHTNEEAAWIEAGCAYIQKDTNTSKRQFLHAEEAGGQLAVLRKTFGGALGAMAKDESQALGGVCIEFECGESFPSRSSCYDALRIACATRGTK